MVSPALPSCTRAVVLTIAALLLAVVMLPGNARAQMLFDSLPNGQSVTGIYYPVEKDGVLIQELRGTRATKMSKDRVDVKDLNLKRYKNGALDMVLVMPMANFYVLDQKLATDKGVVIQFADREIRADEMSWDLRSNSGALKKNVKVILKNFDIGSTSKTTPPSNATTPDAMQNGGGTLPLPSITLPTDTTQTPGATQDGQPVQPTPTPDATTPASQPGDIILAPPSPSSTAP